ncbi:MAG: amidohydrolase family protein [Pseudomonadota bacterium]
MTVNMADGFGRFSLRGSLLLIVLTLVTACGGSETESTAVPDPSAQDLDTPAVPAAPTPTPTQKKTVTISEGTNVAAALSPDGQHIAFSLQGVLFRMAASGGPAEALIGYYYDAREPTWSPDGSRLYFHGYRNGNWDIWSVEASGSDPQAETRDPFDDREAAVSPSGELLAFASDRSGNYDIWVLSLTDGSLTQVTDTPENESGPAWSASGRELAFAAQLESSRAELRILDLASFETRVAATDSGTMAGAAWHPDGSRLSYQLGSPGVSELKVIAADGSTDGREPGTLSQSGDDVFPFAASWSQDGSLLYTANGLINRQLPGGERMAVPFEATFELDRPSYERRRRDHDDTSTRRALGLSLPAISADGRYVTFTALGDLWLWNPDEERLENLTNTPWAERSPQFSPDDNQIAYITEQGPSGTPGLAIYDRALKRHSAVPIAAGGVANPAWSPDGKSIALFASIAGSPLASQLTVVNLEDGSLTPVATPIPAQGISWSSDGSYVATTQLAPYSSRYREGVYRLTVASPTTGERYEVEPVPHRSLVNAALAPFGQSMTYVQDGQLWQQALTEDFQPAGYPEPLTAQLTDSPNWSFGGQYLVFMNADRMLRLNVDTGATEDITPTINWSQAQLNATWTLRIGRLFDGTGDSYQQDVLLTINGNRIEKLEPGAPGEADVDMSDKAAFPGLFEMHGHMGEISEAQGRAWLAWGITSVRDPGSHPYVAKERQEIWDSGTFPGPRTHVTGYLADGNRVYYSVAEGIGSDIHLDRALERAERLQFDFIKTYVRLPDHRQKRVLDFAHKLGIPVSSHELFPAVAHGMDHVEHIGGTSRRGYAPKVSALGRSYQDVVQLLAASGMGMTATAVLPGYSVIASDETDLFDTPQFEHFYGAAGRQAAAMLSRMFGSAARATATNHAALLRDLVAADALLVTGTDSPFVPYGAGLHAELRLFERAGLTPAQILRAATVKSAQAAGVEHDIGTLAPGRIADLVVVDGDPLARIADADNVVMTIKHGRVYRIENLLKAPRARVPSEATMGF